MPTSIDVTDLPQPLVEAIDVIVRTYREQHPEPSNDRRPAGWARALLPELPDAFFEPLPDLVELFEGKPA